jgi:hypothetical protein
VDGGSTSHEFLYALNWISSFAEFTEGENKLSGCKFWYTFPFKLAFIPKSTTENFPSGLLARIFHAFLISRLSLLHV